MVNFVKECLQHCLFGVDVHYPSSAVFNLHRPHTLTADVFLESVTEPAPESFVLFLFNGGQDIPFGRFVGVVLRRFKAIYQVLPPVALPVLSNVITLFLTDRHAKFDVFNRVLVLKGTIDLALSCSAA